MPKALPCVYPSPTDIAQIIADALAVQVRNDWELEDLCIFDVFGAKVPFTRVVTQRSYANDGALISETTQYQVFNPATPGWDVYILAPGDTVGACIANLPAEIDIVEGCFVDADGDTVIGIAGVNTLDGSLVWGPIDKGALGFTSCCPDEPVFPCINFAAFDYDRGLLTPGDFTTYDIADTSGYNTTLAVDYTLTADGVNVSTWYTDVIAAINASPEWQFTLVQDVPAGVNGKPIWRVEYVGPVGVAATLKIGKTPNGDTYNISVDAAGVITGTTDDAGSGLPFGTDPFSPCA